MHLVQTIAAGLNTVSLAAALRRAAPAAKREQWLIRRRRARAPLMARQTDAAEGHDSLVIYLHTSQSRGESRAASRFVGLLPQRWGI